MTLFTLGASAFTLMVLFWLGVTNNFKMAKWHGYVLLAVYTITVLVIVIASVI